MGVLQVRCSFDYELSQSVSSYTRMYFFLTAEMRWITFYAWKSEYEVTLIITIPFQHCSHRAVSKNAAALKDQCSLCPPPNRVSQSIHGAQIRFIRS